MNLSDGWEVAESPPGAVATAGDLGAAALTWLPAQVPGTAAAALRAAGAELDRDLDADDWWFRCAFSVADDRVAAETVLELDGLATVAEVYLNGELILESSSMWRAHAVDVTGRLRAENQLLIACRALAPLLTKRRRPAARWRTRVVNSGNLRWFRTMVFGRSPGFAPSPAAVGPWRPVRLRPPAPGGVEDIRVTTRIEGGDCVVAVRARCERPVAALTVHACGAETRLEQTQPGVFAADLSVGAVERWWPHTHGAPVLHDVAVRVDGETVADRRVGFRTLAYPRDIVGEGLALELNGIPVFVRGAVWTPSDLISLAPSADALRALLERVRDAGMNMLRLAGTGAYESPLFHDLCDELGILVWQDLMFANLDYPVADEAFAAEVQDEAREVLGRLAHRPSLAVVCGNNEVEQQPAMMGLDPALGRDPLWDEVLAGLVAGSGSDCAYVRSTPCGGDLPFQPAGGVVHYFGVSGYMRPTDDARRADVRFAAESLAFANVPDEVDVPVHHPRWKTGVQRDAGTGWDLGAGWDFDDVRDWYLAELYGVDPVQLRRSDHARYLDLSRAATGEVMAEVMGEWRRCGSDCVGALVLWLKDMLPGGGLGVIDAGGTPKVAYHHLRRALAPRAVWTTDEGVGGVLVHVANDRPEPLAATLRVALFRDREIRVAEAETEIVVEPHAKRCWGVERLIGHFLDPAWAYRFGPPAADVIVAGLRTTDGLLSEAFRFPAGRPTEREPVERLGLAATAQSGEAGVRLTIASRRLAYGVRVQAPGYVADDDAFSIEPGGERRLLLRPATTDAAFTGATITALNLASPVRVTPDG
jgi:beta-mannosidase